MFGNKGLYCLFWCLKLLYLNICSNVTCKFCLVSEETLKLFCEAVGIDYQETMVKWRPLNPQQIAEFEEWRPWVDRVLNSSGFLKSTPNPIEDLSTMPENVQVCMEKAKVAYTERLTL